MYVYLSLIKMKFLLTIFNKGKIHIMQFCYHDVAIKKLQTLDYC